jgi:iron complex transport system substrate-binding protein
VKTKIFFILLVGLLLLTALAGCAVQDEEPLANNEPQTVTITDGTGREVTITKPVNTVVSCISMITELMKSLGIEDRIVGIDRSTVMNEFLFGDLRSLPIVQTAEDNHYDVDLEAIIALAPDMFITGVVPQEGLETIIAALEPEIPVVALCYDTPDEIIASVALLGEIFDCQTAADEYNSFFSGVINMITERTSSLSDEDKPKVYYEWMPYFTFNKDLYTYESQITIPGGVNIAADMTTTYGTIDPEWVIKENPDIIIGMAMPYSYMDFEPVDCGYEVDDYAGIEAYRESILNRSELSEVTAVKEGRVYVIHYELPTTSCIGFAYMAKWLHPELFQDLDPQAIHQEWLTRFMKIDYNLDEHGVFVFPEQ